MRIQKFLSRSGVASRRTAEEWLKEGRIRVNGEVITELGSRIDPDGDTVEVDGRVISRPPIRWILLHKPRGHLTTRSDPHGRSTVYEILPEALRPLRYVGRLDQDTEGLLLFTNEGEAIHRLLHPSFEVEREYEGVVEGRPGPDVLRALVTGFELDDGPARAVRARHVEDVGHGAVISLVLTEGRKREVRRLLHAVGFPVTHLKRVRFGPVELGSLPTGEWRDLTAEEIASLRMAVGLPDASQDSEE